MTALTSRRAQARALASLVVGTGAARLARWRRRRRGDHRVFILEYHEVAEATEREGVIFARRFRQHVRYLKRHYRIVPLFDAVRALAERTVLGEDLAVITLDDGYASNYECAYPILRDEGVPATVFVTTGFLDGQELWFDVACRCLESARGRNGVPGRGPHPQTPSDGRGGFAEVAQELRAVCGVWPPQTSTDLVVERLKVLPMAARDALIERLRAVCPPVTPPARPLTWAQVREMQAAGIEIGCHTVSHPILSTLPAALQEAEILRSRDRIAELTGKVPATFAYPNGARGDFDSTTVRIVHAAGIAAACTTVRGSNRLGSDPFRLQRIGVGSDPCFVLAARLAGVFDDTLRARVPWLAGSDKRHVRAAGLDSPSNPI